MVATKLKDIPTTLKIIIEMLKALDLPEPEPLDSAPWWKEDGQYRRRDFLIEQLEMWIAKHK